MIYYVVSVCGGGGHCMMFFPFVLLFVFKLENAFMSSTLTYFSALQIKFDLMRLWSLFFYVLNLFLQHAGHFQSRA